MKKVQRIIILFFIVFSSFLYLGYSKESKQVCSKKTIVKIAKFQKGIFKKYKEFTGTFVFKSIAITSPVSGVVKEIKVSVGDIVSSGTILMIVDNNQSEKIKTVKDDIAKWERILKRRQHWKVRSERAEKQAEQKINENMDILSKLNAEAEKGKIQASQTGKIKEIKVEVGDEVKDGQIVITITDKRNLYSIINILPKYKNLFINRKEIQIKDIQKGEHYNAIIKNISDNFITLWIDNSDNTITNSFDFCFNLLEKELKDQILLSKKVIKKDKKGYFVFVVREKKEFLGMIKKYIAVKKYINIKDENAEKVIIDNKDINLNETIIISAFTNKGKELPAGMNPCLINGRIIKFYKKGLKIKPVKGEKRKKVKKTTSKIVKRKKTTKNKPSDKEKTVVKKSSQKKTHLKPISKKKVKEKERPELKALSYLENNKEKLGIKKIYKGFFSNKEYRIRLFGDNLKTNKILEYLNLYKEWKLCVIKQISTKYIIISFFQKEKKTKRRYKEEGQNKIVAKLFGGVFYGKATRINEMATFFNSKQISPVVKDNKIFITPGIDLLYKLNNKISIGIEGSYLLRKHDFSGKYSDNIGDNIISEYNFSMFDLKEKYLIIKLKLNYLLWDNGIVSFNVDPGIGMYFASFKKEKNMKFSIKQDSNIVYSKNYNEILNTSSSGIVFSINGDLNYKLSNSISFFTSLGIEYLLKNDNWKGDVSYKLPDTKTDTGNLYYIDYKGEKYFWVLNDTNYNELKGNKDYTIGKPSFVTGKPVIRFSIGILFNF